LFFDDDDDDDDDDDIKAPKIYRHKKRFNRNMTSESTAGITLNNLRDSLKLLNLYSALYIVMQKAITLKT
jgi:hypothetical protein